jgi:ketosteroid isomerase-like protein
MRYLFLLSSLFLLMITLSGAGSAESASGKAEVEQVLLAQQASWNLHDLDGFMAGYWNSPQLTFFSGVKENHGWQAAFDRYRATYASPGREMGKLEFSDLRIEMLGADAAFVRGSWLLTMSDGKSPHGLFTLVFRKFPDGWKIVHDHTSGE